MLPPLKISGNLDTYKILDSRRGRQQTVVDKNSDWQVLHKDRHFAVMHAFPILVRLLGRQAERNGINHRFFCLRNMLLTEWPLRKSCIFKRSQSPETYKRRPRVHYFLLFWWDEKLLFNYSFEHWWRKLVKYVFFIVCHWMVSQMTAKDSTGWECTWEKDLNRSR